MTDFKTVLAGIKSGNVHKNEALLFAIETEKEAVELYEAIGNKFPDTKKVATHIKKEEEQHIVELKELFIKKNPEEPVSNPISTEQGAHPKIKFICDKCKHTETFDIRKGATKDTFAKFLIAGGWKIDVQDGKVTCATCMGEFDES